MDVPVLPDDGILLHVGPHKTGTTAIQGALAAARPELMDAGILYPGRQPEHNRPAAAAIGRVLGMWDQHNVLDRTVWLKLAARVRAHPGRAVISSEVFCEASEDSARQLLSELDPDRVTVLVTLRPLERLLPSSWQQYIKSGYGITYEHWLEDVLESRDKRTVTPSLWLRHDHPALIRRWCVAAGGPEHVRVLIVNPSVPRSLFDSFEDLLRLPRNSLNPDESGPRNRSLSLPEVELLRQLNRQVRNKIEYRDYYRYIKRGAVRSLIESRQPGDDESRITTPAWAVQRAREYSRSDVAEIEQMGVGVLGDLDYLAPTGPLPEAQVAEVAETIPAGLLGTFAACLVEAGYEQIEMRRREAAKAALASVLPTTVGSQLDRALVALRWRVRRTRRRIHSRGAA